MVPGCSMPDWLESGRRTDFSDADLSGVDMSHAVIGGSSMRHAVLTGADFPRCSAGDG